MADTQIDSLSISISSNAESATSGIEHLRSTLEGLKTAVSGQSKGLNKISTAMENLAKAVSGMDQKSVSTLSAVVTSLQGLTALSDIKFNKGIVNNLQTLLTTIAGVDDSTVKRLNDLASAMSQLGNVNTAGMRQAASGANQMLERLGRESGKGGGLSSFGDRVKSLLNLKNMFRMVRNGINDFMYFNKVANDYLEDVNLYNVSMGEFAQQGFDFAQKVGDLMGIDPGEFMKYQGVFMTIAKGLGVASDRAAIMSQNLTQLGYDLSSLYNVDFAQSMQRLQSGLTGQIKGMRQFGYDISDVALNQAALALGINKTTDAMNQAEKAELRYYVMMTNVTWAQNDMARTLNQPSNQLRVFKAQLTQVARAIGNLFIPILNAVLPILTAIAAVIKTIINTIGGLFGFQLPEVDYTANVVNDIGVGTEDIADNLGSAAGNAKKMKDYLLSIDELNVLNPDTGSGSGGSGGGGGAGAGISGGGLGFDLPTYDFFNGLVESKANQITNKLKEWLGISQGISSWAELWDTNLGKILQTAIGIGSAIAGWKIFSAVGADGVLGLTLGLTLSGVTMMVKNGVDPSNALMTLIGSTLFAGRAGWKIATGLGAKKGLEGAALSSFAGTGAAWASFVVGISVLALVETAYEYQNPTSTVAKNRRAAQMADMDVMEAMMGMDKRSSDLLDPATGAIVRDIDKLVGNIGTSFGTAVQGLEKGINVALLGNIKTSFETVTKYAKDFANQTNEAVATAAANTETALGGIDGGFVNLGSTVSKLWSDLKNNGEASSIATWWKTNITNKIGSAFGGLGATVSNSLGNATKSSVNSMTDGWNAFISGLGRVVNSVISGISSVMSWTWESWKKLYRGLGFTDDQIRQMGYGTLTSWDYSKYLINKWSAPSGGSLGGGANGIGGVKYHPDDPRIMTKAVGGFVQSGQMFIAREAGAELVGSIGNRTAVANNDQIVESVSQGVYEAVLAAMGGGQSQGDIVIQIDGRELLRASQTAERNRGYNIGMGAFA